jgi:Domain of Unknown Function (DUF1080)
MSQAITTAPVSSAADSNEGWINMFDGKTLEGWEALSNPHVWSVQDGVIVGRHTASVGDDFLPSLLFYTKERCRDFEIKADIKLNHGGVSSIYFRAEFVPEFAPAYIAQANNTGPYPQRTGSLYNMVPIYEQLVADDAWWSQHVIAEGNHIRILVNGSETVNFVDTNNTYTEGYLALLHFQPGSMVQYRNLMMRNLGWSTL